MAAIKDVDKKPAPTCWGDQKKFGEQVGEFSSPTASGGWVHDVAFSQDGNQLAFVAHDSCIYVVDGSQGANVVRFKTSHLPMRTLQWVRRDVIIGAGHDYMPFVFKYTGSSIEELGASKKLAECL